MVPLPLHDDVVTKGHLIWPCVYRKYGSLDLSCSHMISCNSNLSFHRGCYAYSNGTKFVQ
jgi:hypothetical protein